MPETFSDRLKHAWNAFMNRDPPEIVYRNIGVSNSIRPDRMRFSRGNERSIITSVFNRIAMDCSAITISHVILDEYGRYQDNIESGLNHCLTVQANKDQTGRAFIQDIIMSMFDEGCVAVVPVDTTINPRLSDSYDIDTMRTGKIIEWYPDYIKVNIYNDRKGLREDLLLAKSQVAIIENPFYTIMNEPNSTVQRLIRKLNLLDVVDEQSSSGKLDLIIQLPYVIKTEARKQQAENRRNEIEAQLSGSKYGIAYTDGTERITQLNRSIENNLLKQVEYLTDMVYSQLGITKEIMDGTASDTAMLNYNTRVIEPVISAIVNEFRCKFLSESARSKMQTLMFFNNPFKLVPVSQIADIADKFTRNEIMSSNELRQIVGLKPVDSEQADELRNKNINPAAGQEFTTTVGNTVTHLTSKEQKNKPIY